MNNDNQSPANPHTSTTPKNGTGKVITDANIHLLFWGDAWLSASNQPTMASVVTALDTLVSGPYLSKLSQYGVRHAQIADAYVVGLGLESAAPSNFTDTDSSNLIEDLIRESLLPPITNAAGYTEVFALILPSAPGGSGGGWSFAGHHAYKTNAAGKNIYFLVVTSTGNSLEAITIGFSHELVESCTDPDFNEFKFSDGGELADPCQNQYGAVNGVYAQKYWSQSEKACVLPVLPDAPVPAGAERVVNITATCTINAAAKTPSAKTSTFNFTRVANLDNNQSNEEVVITTPSVGGFSADIVMNLTWKSDYSVSVSFTSAFYQGVNSVTSYANSFSLKPTYVETFNVGHELNDNADTCSIIFHVSN